MPIIYSRGGRIGGSAGTTAADLDALFVKIQAEKVKNLVVHFHGGLVDEDAGVEVAKRLESSYGPVAFPIFFVWRSGILDALRQSLRAAAEESAFKQATRKVAEWIAKKAVKKLHVSQPTAAVGHYALASVAIPNSNASTKIEHRVSDQINRYWAFESLY